MLRNVLLSVLITSSIFSCVPKKYGRHFQYTYHNYKSKKVISEPTKNLSVDKKSISAPNLSTSIKAQKNIPLPGKSFQNSVTKVHQNVEKEYSLNTSLPKERKPKVYKGKKGNRDKKRKIGAFGFTSIGLVLGSLIAGLAGISLGWVVTILAGALIIGGIGYDKRRNIKREKIKDEIGKNDRKTEPLGPISLGVLLSSLFFAANNIIPGFTILAAIAAILGGISFNKIKKNPEKWKGKFFGLFSIIVGTLVLVLLGIGGIFSGINFN